MTSSNSASAEGRRVPAAAESSGGGGGPAAPGGASGPRVNPLPGAPNSSAPVPAEGSDHVMHEFAYGHGRLPFFMKLVWLGFLALGAWYMVSFLLTAVGEELGAG